MSPAEIIGPALSVATTVLVGLIGTWFAARVHNLEARVDELEDDQQHARRRELQLEAFIYANGLTPPDPPERN